MAEITVAVEDLEETDHQERCTRLHVQNVEKNVKFHSNQLEKNQFIVMNAFEIVNQKEAIVEEADLVETVAVEDLVETVAVEDLEETDHQERCTRLHVQNVEKNVKFHSNQMDKNQFIVMNVSKTINQKEATVEDISHF